MSLKKPKQGYKLIKSLFGKYEEIPVEWKKLHYQDVCEFINGYAYSATEFRDKGYPIIRIQNLTGGKNYLFSDVKLPEKQFAVKGDLLFAWSATFGPFIWNGPKAAYHYHQWKVVPNKTSNKKFLYYHLAKISHIVKQMGQSGLGMFHMTKSGMEKFPIYLPSIQEQEKIEFILTNVDILIESHEKIIKTTKKLKRGLIQQLLTKGIGHKKFKDSELGKIPVEWNVMSMKEACMKEKGSFSMGPFGSDIKTSNFVQKGVPVIRGINLSKPPFFEEGFVFVTEEKADELKNANAFSGDLLFTHRGTLGQVGMIPYNAKYKRYVISQSQMKCSCDPKILETEFAFIFFSSEQGQKIMFEYSTKSGVPHIVQPLSSLRKFLIILPPILEQHKIISILQGINFRILELDSKKSNLEKVKKGLMQKLLTGQIRVKV